MLLLRRPAAAGVLIVAGLWLAACGAGTADDPTSSPEPSGTAVAPATTVAPDAPDVDPTDATAGPAATTTSAPVTTTSEAAAADDGDAGGDAPADGLDLAVGDCIVDAALRDPDAALVTSIETVPCDVAHDGEVYAVLALDDRADAPFPGDDAVRAAADQRCFGAFEAALGRPYATSGLEIVHLRPPAAAWRAGDRHVVCAVVDLAGAPLVAPVGIAG
ncbi:MAG TPA: septum formation family protein [Acidimicrobiales bacterium]|nr:septum formation family protein [Acidimicrobiales bacterium]